MHRRFLVLSLNICLVAFSCQPDKARTEVQAKSLDFFNALKKDDEIGMARLYPGFRNFDQYYKSDSGKIISIGRASGIITVNVDNRFTNKLGKLSQETISLFFKSDSLGNVTLYDSKGLCDFNENNEYIFGTKTGCINTRIDTSDQQILRKLKLAKQVMLDKTVLFYLELKTKVRITTWNWDAGYGGSGSGQGIVHNGSTYSVPNVKYKVTYKNLIGNTITTDEGYVTYDALDAGDSKSFSFYTSYIGGASKASIELLFDEQKITDYLSKIDWTGNECEEYFKSHPDTLTYP
jgi:hypothetical protein